MATTFEARNNVATFDLDDNGVHTLLNDNLNKLALFVGLSVIDKDLTTPPGSPSDGDSYLIPSGATGAWAGHTDKIAVWRAPLSAWELRDPSVNEAKLLCFIEDENRLVVWNGTNWNLGVTLT